MKRIIVILLSLMPLLAMAKGGNDPRLVIITIDGLRWQEVFMGADKVLMTDPKQVRDTAEEEEFVTPEIIEDEAVSLEDREKHAIVKALERAGGNRKQAAAELHISERTLYRKLKGYNIEQ